MMTDIEELQWEPHSAGCGGQHAIIKFENGYEASCVRGGPFYTKNGTFEIAVMRDGKLDYTTPITNDVLGYLSREEANQALKDIASLPRKVTTP